MRRPAATLRSMPTSESRLPSGRKRLLVAVAGLGMLVYRDSLDALHGGWNS